MEKHTPDSYELIEFNLSAHGEAHFEVSKVSRSYIPLHWHDAVEIISVLEGELTVTVDQEEYPLREGDCIILNPYVLHSTISVSGNMALLLQIPIHAFVDCMGPVVNRQVICDPMTTDPVQKKRLNEITEFLKQMMELEQSGDPAARLRSMSLLLELLYELYTYFSRPVSEADFEQSRKNRERLSAVIAYTEAHYSEAVALESVARNLHLQVNYFCQFFKKHTGMTYHQYLSEYRLAKIYHDLLVTDVPLKHLLERHGFTNYKLFRKLFYEKFQTTPSTVREKQKANF